MKRPLAVVVAALFLSGTAGIINQVIWQRALKLFLGGSETLSSMTVVLVFMAGLGLGAAALGARAHRLAHPLRALALTELLLACVNAVVAAVLSADLSDSVYGVQRVALSLGVPLRAVYAVLSAALLIPPCFLMGVTLPLSSETCQRQLGRDDRSLVGILFFLNTAGAVVGAVGSGFYLLPWFGQRASLALAASCNATAALILFLLAQATPPASVDNTKPVTLNLRPTLEDLMGLALGFLSLGFEMWMLRAMSLAHLPVAFSFAAVLCAFLSYWSLGVYLSTRLKENLTAAIVGTAVGVTLMTAVHFYDRQVLDLHMFTAAALYGLPCIGFGLSYGWLVSKNAQAWGNDVGRFSAFNTVGSCLGILFFTLVGYEASPHAMIGTLGLALAAVAAPKAYLRVLSAGLATLVLLLGMRPVESEEGVAFHGRDGVIEIDAATGALNWDGLEHSHLVKDKNYLGTPNWQLAALPILSHDGPVKDALCIGVGAGVTAGTLAKAGAEVDAYDLNHTLEDVMARFPDGTMNVATDPRIHLIWMDGRTGLALNPKKYDVITQQPTYLIQAGASLLLSKEYFSLVRQRLNPNGVFTIYSNSFGHTAQALLVRETAAAVFPHCISFSEGYMAICSNDPISLTPERVAEKMAEQTELGAEFRELDAMMRTVPKTSRGLYSFYDGGWLPFTGGGRIITDDHPLVEYPAVIAELVKLPGRP